MKNLIILLISIGYLSGCSPYIVKKHYKIGNNGVMKKQIDVDVCVYAASASERRIFSCYY